MQEHSSLKGMSVLLTCVSTCDFMGTYCSRCSLLSTWHCISIEEACVHLSMEVVYCGLHCSTASTGVRFTIELLPVTATDVKSTVMLFDVTATGVRSTVVLLAVTTIGVKSTVMLLYTSLPWQLHENMQASSDIRNRS